MSRKKYIITAAISAHEGWESSTNVSRTTKNAIKITQNWQESCKKLDEIKSEVSIGDGLNEAIDIVDTKESIAYEMKVSGNNAHHELYKDIFKVLVYNENNTPLKKLVFLTEEVEVGRLRKNMAGWLEREYLKQKFGFELELVPF